jgi:hypothetical protein
MPHRRPRLLLVALLLALGCSEGHDELSLGDMTAVDDLSQLAADDSGMPDMFSPQCGDIVRCLVTCGLTNITCDQMCVTGASPSAIQSAGALAVCAATNCLNLDGGLSTGGVNQLGIFMCLTQKCKTEVAMCPNLFGG